MTARFPRINEIRAVIVYGCALSRLRFADRAYIYKNTPVSKQANATARK